MCTYELGAHELGYRELGARVLCAREAARPQRFSGGGTAADSSSRFLVTAMR